MQLQPDAERRADADRRAPPANPAPVESTLFRPEAARQHAARLLGEVHLDAPPNSAPLAALFGAIALAIGAFLVCAQYARTETVPGYLGASVGVSKLYPARRGTVSEVFAAPGSRVRAGQVLLTVLSDGALPDGGAVADAVRAPLLAQRAELQRKLELGAALLAQRLSRARERRSSLAAQLAQLRGLRELAAERAALAEQQLRRAVELRDRGVASETQLREERDRALELQASLRSVDAERLAREDEAAQLAREASSAPLEQQKLDVDLRLELAQLEVRLAELASQSSYAVVAPVAGRIAALQATPGMTAAPEVPVAVILPEGGRLEAHLLVPTRAIGLVETGQRVALKYAAFPYQRFGVQRGRVGRVDGSVLGPGELSTPVEIREPVYRMVAELDSQRLHAHGRTYPLQFGMLLEGDVVLERRSVLEWLLEPLLALWQRA